MSENPVVSVHDVSFRYGADLVLEHISFDIPRGDFLGVIGPNGSGKTTLLKIILGLLEPDSGQIEVFGQPAAAFSRRHRIGYVPQRAGLAGLQFPLTVEETVAMAGGKKPVAEVLAMVGLEKQQRRLLSELSGGQQQRVFIARALATQPELLILDEPTVGVDQAVQAQFYALLRRLNQGEKLTLVLVSHDIDVVAQEVKNIVCLNCQVLYHGEPKDVEEGLHQKLYGKHVRFIDHQH